MKKLIAILTLAAILLTSVLAFADEAVLDGTIDEIQGDIMLINEPVFDGTIEEIQGDVMLISEDLEATQPVYDKQVLDGTITAVEEGQIIINVGAEFAINVDESTIIIDENAQKVTDHKAGAAVRVVASTMVTRSIPPQCYGFVVMVSDAEAPVFPFYAEVKEVTAEEDAIKFATADEVYEIRMSTETQVATLDGTALKAEDVKAGDIVLFYTDMLTFSIPAQGSANKIVVLGQVVAPETEEEVVVETVVTNLDKVVVNGTEVATKVIVGDATLLHVRAVCEAMGLEVAWDNDLFAVTVGTIPMGVNFKIGENSYNKARMMPFTLSAAPQLINDELTYIPVDFLTEILGAQVTIVDGVLNISYVVAE